LDVVPFDEEAAHVYAFRAMTADSLLNYNLDNTHAMRIIYSQEVRYAKSPN
jgi:hypothetical protein